MYYDKDLVRKPSLLQPTEDNPHLDPAMGLFTVTARRKGEFICSYPGYWMYGSVFPKWLKESDGASYGFSFSHKTNDNWPNVEQLLYVTHPCLANTINAAKTGAEVLFRSHHLHMPRRNVHHAATHITHPDRHRGRLIAESSSDRTCSQRTTMEPSPCH